jgi:hypothetical protein
MTPRRARDAHALRACASDRAIELDGTSLAMAKA